VAYASFVSWPPRGLRDSHTTWTTFWGAGQPQRQVLAACLAARDRALPGPRPPQVLPRRFGVCLAEVAAAAGKGRLPLRDPAQGQRRAGAKDRPPAHSPGGPPLAQAEDLLRQLPLSGRVLGPDPTCGGQGGVACGGVVPMACGFLRTLTIG